MKVLVVDGDSENRKRVAGLAAAQGHEVHEAEDGAGALHKLAEFHVAVLITALRLGHVDGVELLKRLRNESALPVAILMTEADGAEMALSAVRELGGFWFLEKPVDARALHALLDRAGTFSRLQEENRELRRELSFQGSLGELVGRSAAMRQVFGLIRHVAPTNAPVVITGEHGSGKELAARAIHCLSKRSEAPFLPVNCAAIPEALIESEVFGQETVTGMSSAGCLEMAEGGTIFFDELGAMPMAVQAKLLRVLEDFRFRRVGGSTERPMDVRVVAATYRAPSELIREGKLREDLYYRLNVFSIEMPPLRDRFEDLPALLDALIERSNQRRGTNVAGFEAGVIPLLETRTWEGNVRELQNVVEKAVLLTGGGVMKAATFERLWDDGRPAEGQGAGSAVGVEVGNTIEGAERQLIEATLRHTSNNKTRAAAILGVSTKTLHAKLRKYRTTPGSSKQ